MLKNNKSSAEYARVESCCSSDKSHKFVGEPLHAHDSKLRSLTVDVILAEEAERRRIAQGLHDKVGHALALAKMKALMLKASAQAGEEKQAIVEICDYLDEAISATRALTFDLSSPVLHEVGLVAALQALGEQLDEQTNLKFHFDCELFDESVAAEIGIIIYRSVEELVLNIIKHAGAKRFRICVCPVAEGIQVSVDDDGVGLSGLDAEGLPEPHGKFGLFSIRTRIEQLGGRFAIESLPEGGTRAVIVVPTVMN